MPKRVVIFVPGILEWPYLSKDWDTRAITWCNIFDDVFDFTDAANYFCTPIGRAFHQSRRVQRVMNCAEQYYSRGIEVSFAAHSNGVDLVLKALANMNWPTTEVLHLVSGAGLADFDQNGLNDALENKQIGRVYVYVAGKDRALRLASTLMGRWLGYGTLGLKGPMNVSAGALPLVTVETEAEFGHSTWFEPAQFQRTMRRFQRGV